MLYIDIEIPVVEEVKTLSIKLLENTSNNVSYKNISNIVPAYNNSETHKILIPSMLAIQNWKNNRGSLLKVFCKKAVLKYFAKFTVKHLCDSFFRPQFETLLKNSISLFCKSWYLWIDEVFLVVSFLAVWANISNQKFRDFEHNQ